MSNKTTQLSIVIRAIDKATAPIKAISARLDQVTKPIGRLQDAIGGLRANSGLDDLIGGFKGVGNAVAGVLSKIALIGGAVGVAVAGISSIVEHFDELGDKAEAIGVSVDFLAQMRSAAERSGASVEQLDSGLKTFTVSMGLARAGTGKMAAFLQTVNPEFLAMLKATKNNEEAFDLLARGAAKLVDPAKRAAFAQKTLGDASLAPLLGKGAKGVKKLRDEFAAQAGSLEGAAAASGEVDDSMKKLGNTFEGVKGVVVEGLRPGLVELINMLADWLLAHRGDIAEWAKKIGKELPDAVMALVHGVQNAVGKIREFVDAIGGWKTVAVGVAAVILGPLIGAIASLGVALMSTPLGWAVGLIAGVVALYKNWDRVVDAVREYVSMTPMIERVAGMINRGDAAQEYTNNVVEAAARNNSDVMGAFFDGVHGGKDNVTGSNSAFFDGVRKGAGPGAGAGGTNSKLTIEISNAPRGTRTRLDDGGADINLNMGVQLPAP